VILRKGEIIFKEGDEIKKAYLIVEGRVSLTSTLGYEQTINKGQIIGEWALIGEAQEGATALTSVELVELEEVPFSWGLLQRAFERLNRVNSFFSSEMKPTEEVSKIITREKKGKWRKLSDITNSPYYTARSLISKSKYEEAFRELMKLDRHSADQDIVNDSEILKVLCMMFFNQENALRRFNALVREKDKFRKYISFAALLELANKDIENMDTMLKMYLKHGMLIPEKTVFITEGETGDESFFILSGYPRVARYSSGRENILAFLGPGEFVGEVATLGNIPRTATVLSSSMVQVLRFSGETLKKVLEENEKFGLEILRSVLNRIRRMRKLKMAGMDPKERLEVIFEGKSLEEINEMKITLDELSSYLNMERSEVISFLTGKHFAYLRSDGTVRFREGVIS
jgi:CRP-like cAMP-binding protein